MPVAIISFSAFAASQVATPGPANMALLATGARFGFRAALPFVAGVALGKQLIIWPIGFGLMSLADTVPGLFVALKWISAAYICYLAWRVAHLRLSPDGASVEKAPGFAAGLVVHPLNPKAWAMIVTGFTSFVTPDTPVLQATATVAICLLACQAIFHPIWTYGGDRIARFVAGRPAERYLMRTLAALTVASVLYVLF
ncbi:LysE family translocator [Shimia thalassica]|uniref:LysE family translocator n=1 Tax=Shimia thalassica TaxID=1715693 RepID=UPI002736AF60|nr:LysE family translocator [Shimia thalassica]MDP2581384.1 LysE family translocator [Shimia thalassica]